MSTNWNKLNLAVSCPHLLNPGLKLAVMFEGSQVNKFAHPYSHHMRLPHFSSVLAPVSSVSRILEVPSSLSLQLVLNERAPISPHKNTIPCCPHRNQARGQHLHLVPLRKGKEVPFVLLYLISRISQIHFLHLHLPELVIYSFFGRCSSLGPSE